MRPGLQARPARRRYCCRAGSLPSWREGALFKVARVVRILEVKSLPASCAPARPTPPGSHPGPFSYSEITLSERKKMTKSLMHRSCFSHCSVSDRLLEKLGEEVLLVYFCYSALIRRELSRTGSFWRPGCLLRDERGQMRGLGFSGAAPSAKDFVLLLNN